MLQSQNARDEATIIAFCFSKKAGKKKGNHKNPLAALGSALGHVWRRENDHPCCLSCNGENSMTLSRFIRMEL